MKDMKDMKRPSLKEIVVKTFKLIKEHRKTYIIIIIFCIMAALFNSLAPYYLTQVIYFHVRQNNHEFQ